MTVLSVAFADLLVSGGPSVAVGALDGGPVAVGGAAISAAAAGLVGSSIIDRFLGDDSEDGDDMDDGGDPFGGDLGGGDDLGADLAGGDLGGGDLGDGGEELGMDEFGEDPFGEGGAGEDATVELQERVDELEDEVASLSSTVNTVRSENKEISETVDEISEDVRGLLDIYEMVTRGINPFVDEGNDSLGGGGFEGGDSLGLFDDGGDDGGDEDLDDEIAGADAESFFDDDPLDEEASDDFDAADDSDGAERDLDMMDDDTAGDDTPADGGGGKSFDELKAEYESGDAEWAGEEDDVGEDAQSGDLDEGFDDAGGDSEFSDVGGGDGGFGDQVDEGFGDSGGDGAFDEDIGDGLGTGGDDGVGGDLADDFDDDGPAASGGEAGDRMTNGHGERGGRDEPPAGRDGRREPRADEQHAPDSTTEKRAGGDGGFEFVGDGAAEPGTPTRPYLTELPEGYVGDLIVIEWLESLVEESDPTDAARAVGYYERIEWISEDVAERLRDFLTGFGPIDANKVDDPGTEILTLDHHVRSLQYIRQLNGASAESLVLGRWDRISDGPGGLGGDRRSLLGDDIREVERGR